MKNQKIVAKTIATKGANKNSSSVDQSMLTLLRNLDLPEHKADFNDAIASYSENMLSALKHARTYLASGDNQNLEEAALELSRNALRLGATNILKSAFELQSVARYKDFTEAEIIVQSLELEYLNVRRDLESAI